MANILVVNDYPLAELEAEVRAGRVPSHLLYGVDYLRRRGHRLVEISGPQRKALAGLDRRLVRLPLPLGSLDHQLRVLQRLEGIDVIYSPCQLRLQLLCLARARGLFKTPMVCLVHHPLGRGRARRLREPWWRAVLGGSRGARFATLSKVVAAELNEVAGSEVAKALTWGADATFYPPPERPGVGVIAAGRTGRDFVTLARAARVTGTPVTIMSWVEYLEPIRDELNAPNIETILVRDEMIPHSQLALQFAKARALAIPLVEGRSLSGLTGVMDALGGGKALLVTRNPTLDLDPDREGIGHALEVGDVEGWSAALREVDQRPDDVVEMGRRARALVDGGLTADAFGAQVESLIEEAIGAGSP